MSKSKKLPDKFTVRITKADAKNAAEYSRCRGCLLHNAVRRTTGVECGVGGEEVYIGLHEYRLTAGDADKVLNSYTKASSRAEIRPDFKPFTATLRRVK